jgi:hypothetical protein
MAMDELEMLKALVQEDPAPDAETLTRGRMALDAAVASEKHDIRRGRFHQRWMLSTRRRWFALPAVIVVGAMALLVTEILPQGSTDLGMQISYANSLPGRSQPHFLDSAVTFGYLPEGFALYSDALVNKVTPPVSFSQGFVFTNASSGKLDTLSIEIEQDPRLYQLGPGGTSPDATVIPMTIHGHRGVVIVRQPLSPSPSGPSASTGGSAPCGPPRPARSPSGLTAPAAGNISFVWQERPNVAIHVSGSGISFDELRRVVDGLIYHAAAGDCLAGSHVLRRSGACQPGITTSPSSSEPTLPPGGHDVGSGTVDGQPWVLFASIEPGNMWFQFNFQGRLLSGSCGSQSLAPDVSVNTTLSGQRFAYGALPAWVTSVTATAGGGFTVSQPVLPTQLHGVGFFALYLGKSHGVCNGLCHGRVTVAFYRGSNKAATVLIPQDMDVSGFRMSGQTNVGEGPQRRLQK